MHNDMTTLTIILQVAYHYLSGAGANIRRGIYPGTTRIGDELYSSRKLQRNFRPAIFGLVQDGSTRKA